MNTTNLTYDYWVIVKNRKSCKHIWLTFVLCDNIIGFPSVLPINQTGVKVRQDTEAIAQQVSHLTQAKPGDLVFRSLCGL